MFISIITLSSDLLFEEKVIHENSTDTDKCKDAHLSDSFVVMKGHIIKRLLSLGTVFFFFLTLVNAMN